MNYYIKCKENGDVIESCDTLEQAESIISKYETEDKADGIYEEDFYEIEVQDC